MKPANVILQKDGTLKLIDFGIAREYKAQASGDTTYIGTNGSQHRSSSACRRVTAGRTSIHWE